MNRKETFNLKAEELLGKIKSLIKEGNVTKITILNKHEKEILSFPVNIGIIGLAFAPILAAAGALAAVITECKLVVEREDENKES